MAQSRTSSDIPRARFRSVLAGHIGKYLAYNRALGRSYRGPEVDLRLLDRFVAARGTRHINKISPAMLDDFLRSRKRTTRNSFNRLHGTIARFFSWLVLQDALRRSPLRTPPRRTSSTYIPYLFDAKAALRLLNSAGRLKDSCNISLRGPTYRLFFALMYGLGLRKGEVRRLRVGDFDQVCDVVTIHESKFQKSRLIPCGPRISALIRRYLAMRAKKSGLLQAEDPLLSMKLNAPVGDQAIYLTFHMLIKQMRLKIPDGVATPRPHHLRHSFAVGRLLAWYRDGVDVASRLLPLSTFLGHVDPCYTAVYLTITTALLNEGRTRYERYAAPLYGKYPS